MIQAKLVTNEGKPSESKATLPEKWFGADVKPEVLAQNVRVYLSNRRKSHAKTKTRSEVAKTTAKMYKQKGTGRARHGAYSAPIFVGGGIAHGPTGGENYKLGMLNKMRAAALAGAMSEKAKDKLVWVVEDAEKIGAKAKKGEEFLQNLKLENGKTLIVVISGQEKTRKSFQNIGGVSVADSNSLNPYLVLNHKNIIFTKEALAKLIKW